MPNPNHPTDGPHTQDDTPPPAASANFSALAAALRKSRDAPTQAEALAAVGVNATGDGPLNTDEDKLRTCDRCGAVCDSRVQVCECGPTCPYPPVV